MIIFGNGTVKELQTALRDLEEKVRVAIRRIESLEEENARKMSRRDFWVVKMIPAIALSLAALAALNQVFHWTG